MTPQESNTLKIVSAADLINDVINYIHRERLCKYNQETDTFDFTDCDYWIPASDMKSPKMLAHWFRHMSEKSWVTTDHLHDLAAAVEEWA